MSQQNIIFCDRCNSLQVKVARGTIEEHTQNRRLTDERSFYIGTEREAYDAGWTVLNGLHHCVRCKS